MLQRKNFPQNTCALQICAEEFLRETLKDNSVSHFCSLMNKLDSIASKSRTAHLWLDALIWPVFLFMRFVRTGREADWPLHIDTLKRMLPYFAAAGHWHYFRYATVYLIKMTKLPKELLGKFIDGEHAMRHQNGMWNAIRSDMMIKTTVMHYGHGPTGMKRLTFNEKVLDRWAKTLHISSIMEKYLLNMNDSATTSDVTYHKEDGSARVKEEGQDIEKICAFLSTCINLMSIHLRL